jgi:hypothetical protein
VSKGQAPQQEPYSELQGKRNSKDEELRKESKGRLESRQSGENIEWDRRHGLLEEAEPQIKGDVCEARNN